MKCSKRKNKVPSPESAESEQLKNMGCCAGRRHIAVLLFAALFFAYISKLTHIGGPVQGIATQRMESLTGKDPIGGSHHSQSASVQCGDNTLSLHHKGD